MAQAKHKFDFGPNVFGKKVRIECYTLVLTPPKYARFSGNLCLIQHCCGHLDESIIMDTSALNGKGMIM